MLEQVIQFGNPAFGFRKCFALAGKLRVTLPQTAVRCFLDKLGFVLRYILDCFPQVPQHNFIQDNIFTGMGRTLILAFPISGADKIFLFLGKVRCAALIHLAAALCTIEQPRENTHIAHFGRAAA